VRRSLNSTDREGNTALHRAAGKGQMKSLRILLDRGIDIDHRNRKGQTALFIAALNGQKAAVRTLLKRGADSRMADNKGITPLLAALRGNHHELALELADHPASDRNRYQALILAIQKRQQKLALKLLDTKIPLRLMRPDKRGRSLLWLAADQGMPALVKRLAAQNPDLVDRPDRSGYTPLARAVKRGFVTTASLLIDLGARLDTVTAEGNSLPILAVLSGKPDMLQRVLAHEPALNIRNNHGDTAIMLAASAGNERLVSLLIEAGADLQMRNSANQNAEQLARKNGHRKVAEMIRARKPALLRLFE